MHSPSAEEVIEAVRGVYEKRQKLADFDAESGVISAAVRELVPQLDRANFAIVAPRAIGSTAVVFECFDRSLEVKRALKLPRPRFGKVSEVLQVIRAERAKLASLSHPNLIRIYFAHEVRVVLESSEYELPYFVMDFLTGIKDLDEFVVEHRRDLTPEQFISYWRDVIAGVANLHRHGIMHCDIKPANLLIADGTPALVADLGYAKNFLRVPKPDDGMTTVTYTPTYAHPELKQHMIESSDSNANRAEIPAEKLRPAYDLYSIGQTLNEVLGKLRAAETVDAKARGSESSLLTQYQWQYLSVIAARLLDGQPLPKELQTIELPPSVMNEIKYFDASEALEDIEKLLNLYDLEGEVPELNPHIASYVQVPLAKVPLTPRVKSLMAHPLLMRLGQVTQLGFVSLVYPGACHTREEHALGTFAATCNVVRALWYDETSAVFRSVMRRSDLEAVLAAALLHDVSQYPMAHDLTEVSSDFAHEDRLENALRAKDGGDQQSLAEALHAEWNVDVAAILAIVDPPEHAGFRTKILHSLISGPLDADKMDYLRRDSHHLGVDYGHAIDCERLLRNVSVVYTCARVSSLDATGAQTNDLLLKRAEVGVSEKALAAAGGLWRVRKDMYRQVYWQHTVRAFKAMLSFSVRRCLLGLNGDARDQFWHEFDEWLYDWQTPIRGMFSPNPSQEDDKDELSARATAVQNSALHPTDDSLFSFLSKHMDQKSQELLRMIRRRTPFRRVAVISRAMERTTYEALYHRIRGLRLSEDHIAIETFRAGVEEGLVDLLIDKLTAGGPTPLPKGVVLDNAREAIKESEPFLLIDVPIKASSHRPKEESLLYISEDDIGVHARGTAFPNVQSARLELEGIAFDMDVGKIRMYVTPLWADTVARSVPHHELVALLGA